jgi:hypothetical protein
MICISCGGPVIGRTPRRVLGAIKEGEHDD